VTRRLSLIGAKAVAERLAKDGFAVIGQLWPSNQILPSICGRD